MTLKEKLASGSTIYGSAIISNAPLWAAVVKRCGLDFVFLDTEHTPIGRTELAHMCQIYKALDLPPIVRIPSPDPYQACMVLDGGAAGVIAPYLEEPDQIRALISAVKSRPLKGRRLARLTTGMEKPEPALDTYIHKRNRDTLFIANLESVPALENLDEILDLPGLDGVFIGPHDLSCSLGLAEQYDHPLFEQAVERMVQKARAKNIAIGIHFSEGPERQIRWAKAGANIIVHSSDIALFSQRLSADLAVIRAAIEPPAATTRESQVLII